MLNLTIHSVSICATCCNQLGWSSSLGWDEGHCVLIVAEKILYWGWVGATLHVKAHILWLSCWGWNLVAIVVIICWGGTGQIGIRLIVLLIISSLPLLWLLLLWIVVILLLLLLETVVVLLTVKWSEDLRWLLGHWSSSSYSFNLLYWKLISGLPFILLTISFILLIHVHYQFLHMIACHQVLIIKPWTYT